jgi:hypothetical protein
MTLSSGPRVDTFAEGYEWYDKKRGALDTLENRDRSVVVDRDTGEHEIGDTDDDAERRFVAKYGSDRRAAMSCLMSSNARSPAQAIAVQNRH